MKRTVKTTDLFDKQGEFQKISKIAAMYNMIPNLLWTAIFLIPITMFCYSFVTPKTIYTLLAISFIPVFFPNSFFDKIQLSRNARWYTKIGVKHINTFAQSGSLINKIVRKKYANFKAISKAKASIKKQYLQTYVFEKFHFSLFLFFTSMIIYAATQGHIYWMAILIISNLLYNIYPNLLQQYIRIKLKSAIHRHEIS